jgi:hypothetical protein
MRNFAAACLLLASSGVRAQVLLPRLASAPAAVAAPAALAPAAAPLLPAALVSPALAGPALAAPGSGAAPAVAEPAPAAARPVDAPAARPTVERLTALAAAVPDVSRAAGDAARGTAEADFTARLSAALGGKDAPPAPEKAAAPRLQREHALDLRPTQMSVGMREVGEKADHLRGMKPEKADAWLKERPVPVVLGPRGRMYLIDHHHLVRAAWEAGITHVHVEVKADLSGLSEDEFWSKMKDEKWVYPYDQFGKGPHDVQDLPENVRGLADDPYRSVAGAVRDRGGYEKSDEPFAEFLWAQFFRERLKVHPIYHDFEEAVAEAVKLAKTEAAKHLPGWLGGK